MSHIRGVVLLFIIFGVFLFAKDRVVFDLNLSSKRVYLGEPILATFTLSYPVSLKVDRVEFKPKEFEAFEFEELNETKEEKFNSIKYSYYYLLTPIKLGSLSITPQIAKLSYQNPKNYRYITHSFKTKRIKIIVREVPNMLKIVGDYKMDLSSDTNSTKANHPIHLILKITGKGNSKYIPPFNLKIPNAIVYPSKPTIHNYYIKDGYKTEFIQRFSLIGEQDFTITPIKFRYFNTKIELPQTLQSHILKIKVDNPQKTKENWLRLGFFILGILVGILAILIFLHFYKKRENKDLIQRIRKIKSDKELYRLLLPLSNNSSIRQILKELEERIYTKSQIPIDRKRVIKIIQSIKL